MLQLHVETGPGPGRKIPVKERATIGRLKTNEVPLPDASVSRQHARVVVQNGKLMIRDLGSANGTTLNGDKIDSGIAQVGDTIGIGNCVLRVEQAATASAAPAATPPAAEPAGSTSRASTSPAAASPAVAPRTGAPRPASGARPQAASSMEVGGVEVKSRKKTLQYSEHAGGPADRGLLHNDVDQQPAWIRLALYAGIGVVMLVVIFGAGKIVDIVVPDRVPATTETDEDFETLDETEVTGSDAADAPK